MSYQGFPPQGPGGPPPPPQQYGGQPGYYPPPQQGQYPQGGPPPPQQPGGAAGAYYGGSPAPPQQAPPPQDYNASRAFPGGQQPFNPASYGQPGGYPPQQAYGAPPPQGQYGGPPPGQYGAPPQGQYGAPPPGQYGAPPQGQYGAPPPGQYGAPPPGQYGAPAPSPYYNPHQAQPGPYGAPAGQYQGAPVGPSPGYELPPRTNPNEFARQADDLRKAMKGFGTDEDSLIRIMVQLNTPYAMLSTYSAFTQRHKRDLIKDIKSETSGHFEDGLVTLARGPLSADVHALHSAIHRPGTTESMLDSVLLGRSNADLQAIIKEYHKTFNKSLEADVRGDLSLKTEDMFRLVLMAHRNEDSMPVDHQQIEKDAYNLHFAIEGSGFSIEQATVYATLLTNNDLQIQAICQQYERMYNKSLESVVSRKFNGHMKQALLYVIHGATDRAMRDAQLLEDTMKGAGTKDSLLIHHLVKIHWDQRHFGNVKAAYLRRFGKSLETAIKGETSGDYENLLVAICMAR